MTNGPSDIAIEPDLPPMLYRLTFCEFVIWEYNSYCNLDNEQNTVILVFGGKNFFNKSDVRRNTNSSVNSAN